MGENKKIHWFITFLITQKLVDFFENVIFTSLYKNSKTYDMTTEMTINEQIEALKTQLTGDLFADMDIKDEIHNLEMKLNGVKPMDSHIDCVGCGS